jgi:hypothetical protein
MILVNKAVNPHKIGYNLMEVIDIEVTKNKSKAFQAL